MARSWLLKHTHVDTLPEIMAKNMETPEQRLKRFERNDPSEVILTLLNSIHNNFVMREILPAATYQLPTLVFLGTHAVAETIAEGVYGKSGLDGFRFYLENFVDECDSDLKFSTIATELNDWRNILAHQWIGSMGHNFGLSDKKPLGWWRDEDNLIVNPTTYAKQFSEGFSAGGTIWDFENMMDSAQKEAAKERLIKKYLNK